MSAITARELAQRTRSAAHVPISPALVAEFLADWVKHGLVEEVLPGRYRLTAAGWNVAHGLLEPERDEEQAA